ncbi:MAG TPA: hypothetical protein VK752_11570 [Bryobacteraceae bacterium]|jgi:hypothetical protein|nr:hypothetical protein [Bryobacteraceae bacterium]
MGVAVLLAVVLAFEDPPKDVIDFFRSVAATLADGDRSAHDAQLGMPRHATEFLDHFDKAMPGYEELSSQVENMVGAGEVATNIDFINTAGNEKKRTLDLDWVLHCEGQNPKRAVIQCTIEKRGKKWKITAIAPIEFFKRE